MTHLEKPQPDFFTVELRFLGEDLKLADVSRTLGLTPSLIWDAVHSERRMRGRKNLWAYDGEGAQGFQREWTTLEAGLAFLIDQLSSLKGEITAISQQHEGFWWCGHFYSNSACSTVLSPRLMNDISKFNLRLCIESYYFESS